MQLLFKSCDIMTAIKHRRASKMITAIISEFNPITNGHKHIINQAKQSGDTVLCLMSGNFVQRGEGAILPKHARGKMAVLAGADLVCELPVHFSCSNAETFAYGAVKLLSQIPSCHRIMFGSESGDIELLSKQADFSENAQFKKTLAKKLDSGDTFAKAKAQAEKACGFDFSASPNDVLGVEYIKAGKKLGFEGKFETIKRLGSDHDSSTTQNEFASASYIRSLMIAGELEKARAFVPTEIYEILKSNSIVDCSALGVLASYQGIYGKKREEISEVSEGLENLMFQNDFYDFSDYAMNIKSKRYTLARIKRMSIKSILNITKNDIKFAKKHIAFLKVIAVKKSSVGIFSKEFNLKLIKRGKDAESLGNKQRKIYNQMQSADMVYSIFSKTIQTQMEVCD